MNLNLNKISKTLLYFLVFLIPIFFLPFTPNVLDFPKEMLLIFLTVIALSGWLLRCLFKGKIKLKVSPLNFIILFYLFFLAISSIFSLWPYGSFFGQTVTKLTYAIGFLAILGLAIFYFLLLHLFQKEELPLLFLGLGFSSFLAILFSLVQIFGKHFLPFDFARDPAFHLIGTLKSTVLFAACLLPIIISFIFITKKVIRIFFIVASLVFLAFLFLTNFWLAWILVLAGSAILLMFGIQKREAFPFGFLLFAMFLFVVAFFLGVFRPLRFSLQAVPNEILSQKITFEISKKTLMENPPLSLLFGSGPSTFGFDYSKFKPQIMNQGLNWILRFGFGASEILEKLATTGILGLISFLAILIFLFFLGLRFLFGKTERGTSEWILISGIFSSLAAIIFSFFFSASNFSLLFIFWFLSAGLVILSEPRAKSWKLAPSSLANIGFSFIFIFILGLGAGLLLFSGQKYLAEFQYQNGLEAYRAGDNQKAIDYLIKAINLSQEKEDSYWRDLSQLYLFRVNEELQKGDFSKEEFRTNLTNLSILAINSAKKATDLSPHNVNNWSVRAFIYQSLSTLDPKLADLAIQSYQEAIKLENSNPYFYTEVGKIYLAQNKIEKAREYFQKAIEKKSDYSPAHFQMAMSFVQEGKLEEGIAKLETLKENLPQDSGLAFQLGLLYYNKGEFEKAKNEFERAVKISPHYSNARYFLGLIYDKEGKKDLAIEQFLEIEKFNPENQEVKKILSNLREGKSALEGIVPSQPPIEEKRPEKLSP